MNILPQIQLAPPTAPGVSVTPLLLAAATAATNDPLIDKSGHNIVFAGAILLAILIVVVIGILSPKIEHAIIAALVLSLGLIALFFAFSQ